jgi:hypothetical protein
MAGAHRKVWWHCSKNNEHEWEAVVKSRNKGIGCPFCAGQRLTKKTCLLNVNPGLSKEWHPAKNGALTPRDIMAGSNIKVWWQCSKLKEHEWEAVVSSRNIGRGCPYCAGQKVSDDNCLFKRNPNLAREWHPTKNGNLTARDVIPGSNKKAWWQCIKNNKHEWEAVISSRNNGNGCPLCDGRKLTAENCLLNQNPELAKEWHPTKNGRLTPKDVMPGSNRKVWWQCSKNKDHEWETQVNSRSKGRGCLYCMGQRVWDGNCLLKRNPNLAREWHPTKNGTLTPRDVMPGSARKVWWLCQRNHSWLAQIKNRYHGRGCPECRKLNFKHRKLEKVSHPTA